MGSISEIQKGVASLVVEPDGDAFFVLKYANKQEYIWPGREKPATTATATSSPSGTELTSTATTESAGKTTHRFQVSSQRLSAASPVWASALADSHRQHGRAQNIIETEGWDVEAISALLDVIHMRSSHVDRTFTLDLLAKVAVLVHHYKCHDAVREAVSVWFDETSKGGGSKTAVSPGSKKDQEEAVKELFVAWEFSRPELFTRTALRVIYTLDGAMETMGLPFTCALVYAIDNARHKIIEDVLDYLLVLLDHLAHPARACPRNLEHSEKCSALLLGQLIRFMRNALGMQVLESLNTLQQQQQHPVRPFYGLSVVGMQLCVTHGLDDAVTSCEPPVLQPTLPTVATKAASGTPGGAAPRPCSLKSIIQPFVEDAVAAMQQLRLEDFPTTSRPGRTVVTNPRRARRVNARRSYTEGHLRLNKTRVEQPRRSRAAIAKSAAKEKAAP